MSLLRHGFTVFAVLASTLAYADDDAVYDAELAELASDLDLADAVGPFESARLDQSAIDSSSGYAIRSRHFVFGIPPPGLSCIRNIGSANSHPER